MLRLTGFIVVAQCCIAGQHSGSCLGGLEDMPNAARGVAGAADAASDDEDEAVRRFLEAFKKAEPFIWDSAQRIWTYERLSESADVIVIGRFSDKRELECPHEDVREEWRLGEEVVAVESRFRVVAVLRSDGKCDEPLAFIRLLHFHWQEIPGFRSGGAPKLIDFSVRVLRQRTEGLVTDEGVSLRGFGDPVEHESDRDILMFLSRREDGRFEPVSGQYFPNLSFRRLGGRFFGPTGPPMIPPNTRR